MGLRPRIVKLIDKYSQKRGMCLFLLDLVASPHTVVFHFHSLHCSSVIADLVSMNETFIRARTIFDRMMEESLARHTGIYDQPTYQSPYPYNPQPIIVSPESRTEGQRRHDYPTNYISTSSGYPGVGQPGPVGSPQAFLEPQPSTSVTGYYSGLADFSTVPEPASYIYSSPAIQVQTQPLQQSISPQHQPIQPLQLQQQDKQAQPRPQPLPVQQQPQQPQQPNYIHVANTPYATPIQQQQPQSQVGSPHDQPQGHLHHGQTPYQPSLIQGQSSLHMGFQDQPQSSQHVELAEPARASPQSQHATLYNQVQSLSQSQHQESQSTQSRPVGQLQPVKQPIQQTQSKQLQPDQQESQRPQSVQLQQAAQPQQHQHQPSLQSGPPYIFDPKATYSDPNVQAWARYYAQGGHDLAGSVYFVNVPGLTDGTTASRATTTMQGVVGPDGGSGQNASQSASGNEEQHRYDYASIQQPQQTTIYGVQSPVSYFNSSSPTAQHLTSASFASPGSTSNLDNDATLSAISPGEGTTAAYEPSSKPSPTSVSTIPSWVLPKKDNSGGPGVQGLTGRFAGVSLTDPGSAHA